MVNDLGGSTCRVEVRGTPSEPVICVGGELDIASAPQVREHFIRCLDGGARRVIVDCAELTFVCAAGLSLLVETANALDGQGGEVVLRSPSPFVMRLLEITGVEARVRLESTNGIE